MSEQAENDLKACSAELLKLQEELDKQREDNKSSTAVSDAAGKAGVSTVGAMKIKTRTPKGLVPDNKVSDVSWHPLDNGGRLLCTVLQDGKIIIFDAKVGAKMYFLSQNTWLMCAEFSPDGKHLAVAGLDNKCTIHDIPDLLDPPAGFDPVPQGKKTKAFEKHGGYVGSTKWLDDKTVITGSGDKSIMLWDITLGGGIVKEPVDTFLGHGLVLDETGDVSALATIPGNSDVFLSGASDNYCKMWDKRMGGNRCAATFSGHTDNVNKMKILPGHNAFITASEDMTSKIFDLRCGNEILSFSHKDEIAASAVAVSKTGRMAFTGYSKGNIVMWDTLTGGVICETMDYHKEQVTSIETSLDGMVVASSARDRGMNLALWA